MNTAKLQQGFSLMELIIVVVIIGILALLVMPANDYYPRALIAAGIALASSAKTAVAENLAKGKPLNAGWIAPNATAHVSTKAEPTEVDYATNANTGVSINPTNGIITITYTNAIATGSPTILLLPIIDGILPVSGMRLKADFSIKWECHSATAPANDALAHIVGTLADKYAPPNCRF